MNQYIHLQGVLKGPLQMQKPFEDDFTRIDEHEMKWTDLQYYEELERFEAHLKDLPSYPVLGANPFKEGEILEEGKGFKIMARSIFYEGSYMNICYSCKKQFKGADKLWFMCPECCNERVAIPLRGQEQPTGHCGKNSNLIPDLGEWTDKEITEASEKSLAKDWAESEPSEHTKEMLDLIRYCAEVTVETGLNAGLIWVHALNKEITPEQILKDFKKQQKEK